MWSWVVPLSRFSFWVNPRTLPFSPWVDHLILFCVVLLLITPLGIAWQRRQIKEKIIKRVLSRVSAVCLCAGLIGLVLYGITWQRIPVLGVRILWPIWFFAHAAWGLTIYLRARQEIPAVRRAAAERQAYEKWLPKAKK